MRSEYWGYCLSRALEKIKVTCELDYLNVHTWIKLLLTGTYIQPLQSYELWDSQNSKSSEEKDEEYARVLNNCG